MSTENNGYLDADQTIVNFAVRELGISFEQLLNDDPNRMLRNWLKCRKTAKGTAIGTTIMGAIGVMGAVVTGATPLLIAGLAVAGISGLMVKQHSDGEKACSTELGILDQCRPILTLLMQLERRGANRSDLVSTYDRLIRAAASHYIDVQDKDRLQAFFQRELEQVAVFSRVAASVAPAVQQPATQLQGQLLPDEDAPGHQHEDELQDSEAKGAIQAAVYPPVTAVQQPADAPDLSRYINVKQRMQVLLEALAASGCPIGSLLNHPFVWCWGRSQSGKTSIALLLAMARMALGHRVSYFTTDDDYPRELRWQRDDDSPEGYAVAIDDVASTIATATKGGLMGQGWVFDELYAASATHSIKIQPLLTCILMKGAKTRGGAIGISQADTSTAHGLKGIDSAWREERVSIQAIHQEDAQGNRAPTGRYQVQQGDDMQTWQLPRWMLTERNQRGDVDPIAWMLKQFPELKQATPEHRSSRAQLEQLYRFDSETRPEMISTSDETTETAKQDSETTETPYTASNLAPPDTGVSDFVSGSVSGETMPDCIRRVLEMRRNEMNQTQIIAIEWGLKPGDSKAYRDAVAEYKAIIEGL